MRGFPRRVRSALDAAYPFSISHLRCVTCGVAAVRTSSSPCKSSPTPSNKLPVLFVHQTVWTLPKYGRIVLIMRHVRLKISDLATVTGYTRFQMRGLLDEVFPNPERGKGTASQRIFSPHDLLVVTVACEIEQKYGVKRAVLALVSEVLRETLTGPRTASRDARLAVTFMPPTATYLVPDATVPEGLVLALGTLFAKVDEYLGVAGPSSDSAQAVLPLSPAIVTAHRGGGSRGR